MKDPVKTLLIGVGNSFRSDDGAGVVIAEKMRAILSIENIADVEVAQCSGEGVDLMMTWQGYDKVYLFDAVMSQGKPGQIHRLQASEHHFPSDFFKYSSHAFSLAEAVELARTMDSLPREVIVYGIEGNNFQFGEKLGDEVAAAVDKVVEKVLGELKEFS